MIAKRDVFVCSAFQGLEQNLVRARTYCRYVLKTDEFANLFCPHLFYPLFLNEDDPLERAKGIELGVNKLWHSGQVWVFVSFGVLTSGMLQEIEKAIEFGVPQFYFDATDVDNIVEMRHIPSGVVPTMSQLLSPKPFAKSAAKTLASIAGELKVGVRYEDLQAQMEALLGPVDACAKDVEADAAWEAEYRRDND
jgi:hypothetical protein